ncbi:MAG TPA: hypothetical protein VEA81_17890 [Burkholderiaceae bacterium]|nr:hypothetical protein [Burkholderiaceae bacterium]
MIRRDALRALGALALAAPARAEPRPAPAAAAPFEFALIGDLPYSSGDEAVLAAMLSQLDAEPLAFVLHVGDIKGGREPCSDALYARRRAVFDRSAHPLVLLPGDNEWTDCHRRGAGAHDPVERLAALRRTFWSSPAPLGRASGAGRAALALERQRGMPENVRWRVGPVHFVAVHVVGSNNGFDEYPGSRGEFSVRQAANREWLSAAVDRALDERADALVIAAHANPGFDWTPRPGFAAFTGWLQEAASRFRNPIAYLHGDSHRFRVDQPLADRDGRTVPHFTRIESFGHPFTSQWVRIAYDPTHPARFHVTVREVVRGTG